MGYLCGSSQSYLVKQRGMVLIFTLLMIFITMLIVSVAAENNVLQTKMAENSHKNLQAFWSAETALAIAVARIDGKIKKSEYHDDKLDYYFTKMDNKDCPKKSCYKIYTDGKLDKITVNIVAIYTIQIVHDINGHEIIKRIRRSWEIVTDL